MPEYHHRSPIVEDIVVVDDSPDNLKLLSGILHEAGYVVRPANSAALALRTIRARPPALVLLDVKMPHMNGFEVCRHLKAETATKDIPVMFISAADDVSSKVEGFEAGGVDYISKPFQEGEVLARVHNHMYLYHMHQELERARDHLEEANARLRELDRLKSMFIASMSHELRTPLNSIIGFTGLILQGLLGKVNDEQADSLNRVEKSATHLLELITDVIDISKIESGHMDFFPRQCSLKGIVDEAVETIQPQLEAKALALEVWAGTWPQMYTDRKRLLQCLLNYLSNAVKFTEHGTVSVAVREVGRDVEISVRDTGIGIAEQDLPRVFEAFERLESRLRVKAGGTGLGLYLTRKIATELLQGAVSVESRLGEGSTFRLRLPVRCETPPPPVKD